MAVQTRCTSPLVPSPRDDNAKYQAQASRILLSHGGCDFAEVAAGKSNYKRPTPVRRSFNAGHIGSKNSGMPNRSLYALSLLVANDLKNDSRWYRK